MTVNNLELLANPAVLHFPKEDGTFIAHVQIIQREKDGVKQARQHVIKEYFIHNQAELLAKFPEMKDLADHFKARVYLNLNVKSAAKVFNNLMVLMANRLQANDFHKIDRLFTTALTTTKLPKNQRHWLVDVDTKDQAVLEEVKQNVGKDVLVVDTVNGYHVITGPFNLLEFNKKFPGITVHKDNPTLLYAP